LLLAQASVIAKRGDRNRLHIKAMHIQSAKTAWKNGNKAYWDVPGYPGNTRHRTSNGEELQIWDLDDGNDRFFLFYHIKDDLYKMRAGYQGRFVYFDRKRKGQDLRLARDRDAYRVFKIKYLGGYKWKILTKDGKYVVCLEGGNTRNNTAIHLWPDHDAKTAQWVFRRKNLIDTMHRPSKKIE
jgi:hypothetical protein